MAAGGTLAAMNGGALAARGGATSAAKTGGALAAKAGATSAAKTGGTPAAMNGWTLAAIAGAAIADSAIAGGAIAGGAIAGGASAGVTMTGLLTSTSATDDIGRVPVSAKMASLTSPMEAYILPLYPKLGCLLTTGFVFSGDGVSVESADGKELPPTAIALLTSAMLA